MAGTEHISKRFSPSIVFGRGTQLPLSLIDGIHSIRETGSFPYHLNMAAMICMATVGGGGNREVFEGFMDEQRFDLETGTRIIGFNIYGYVDSVVSPMPVSARVGGCL